MPQQHDKTWVQYQCHWCILAPCRSPGILWTIYPETNINVMSFVAKSTCSGFKTGLYISYHGGNTARYIKKRGCHMKDVRISGYFDTKYMTVLWIEQILHTFEDDRFANFFNGEQVNFRMTLIMYVYDSHYMKWLHTTCIILVRVTHG